MTTTVTMSGPGTTTIVDDTAAAVTALTAAVTAQTAVINSAIGVGSSNVPTSVSAQASATAEILDSIALTLMNTNVAIRELNVNVGLLTKQVGVMTTGVAHSVNLQAQQLTTQQMVAADQIKNNKFQQVNTNTALTESGKEPIVVKPDDLKTEIIDNIKEVGTIKTQTAATTFIADAVTGGINTAYTTSVGWAAETAVGQFIADQFLWVEALSKSIFSDKTAKELYIEAKNTKAKAKAGIPG